MAYNELGLPT